MDWMQLHGYCHLYLAQRNRRAKVSFSFLAAAKGTGTRFPGCMLTRVCAIQLLGLFLHQ